MTALHSVMMARSLARRSAARECWPEHTVHTPDDVIIEGTSLASAATTSETPVVRIGVAEGALAHRPAHPARFITVVLTRVEQILRYPAALRPEVWVDAELGRCRALPEAARLLDRESIARLQRMRLRPDGAGHGGVLRLPRDLAVGDLLAIPCEGAIPLNALRRQGWHPERLDDDRFEGEQDDFPYPPSCLK